ncbi:NERD domain-containing protein [Sutcliffiella horikoshii]|nr:NERD domain-containing protein [Sutcliffiella horikoshii]
MWMSLVMKERMEPGELNLLRMLKARGGLKDDSRFWNLEKGYQGEVLFDKWFSCMEGEWIVVNDLLLDHDGSVFQIDSLVIGGDRVYLFEVKNFEGDFYLDDGRWLSISKKEIKNPLLQMQRCEIALRQLLRSLGYQSPIESNLFFINPEFTLFNCLPNLPIVFCSQMNRFSKRLMKQSSSSGKLHAQHSRLAEKLCELHIEKSPYERLPEHKYDELRKGIVCAGCGGMGVRYNYRAVECDMCGHREVLDMALKRSIYECCTLFPEKKITTKIIHDWIRHMVSKRVIQRVLHSNFSLIGHGKSAFYVKEEKGDYTNS